MIGITVSKSKIIDKESESYKEAKSREMIQGPMKMGSYGLRENKNDKTENQPAIR